MSVDASRFGAEYYEENYRNYQRQNPGYKMDFYRRLVLQHAPGDERPRILDMGCAFGRFLACMDHTWCKVGMDISEYAVIQASRSLCGIHFAVGSCTAIPFRGPFHAIVAFDVIEHVPDLDAISDFVNSELDPNGVFVFVVPVYDGPLGGVVRRLDKDPTHVHRNSRESWLKWAREQFEVVSWTGIFRYLLPGGPYINWPTRALRSIAPAIAVTARRRNARQRGRVEPT